ncbi:MAG: PadR family transcriptional regulator [Sphingomonadaceae bacterium]|nr:PadR family transcriptional regulator [Sphingomonadaceae bacterium]
MWHHHHDHHRHGTPRGFGRGGFGGRFGAGFGFREEGGRARRVFDGGELRLVLLKLIADEPRHGYDLIRAIEERTGGAYAPSPGVIYPTITMLQDMGQIEEQASEGAKRSFAATDTGRAHLDEKSEEVAALFARLDALGTAARRSEGTPVRRAMHNLRLVLQQSLESEVDPARLHEIADILDEAAKRIERL